MAKNWHEIRDPIHTFVRLDTDERRVLDSRPFQRLRHIHQLSLTYLIYPGATHRRFEHSLGVMELAGRVFDVVTHQDNITDRVRAVIPEITQVDHLRYWRRVLRMAALCHDLGHLPFSHGAEALIEQGKSHEDLTKALILSDEMKTIWSSLTPPLRADDIALLTVGPKKAGVQSVSSWKAILSEIIVGDAFGVDRMDYLLRDSHHLGVAYGKFDHNRLIDTLRILPSSPTRDAHSQEPALGVEEGGLQSAEALLWARYLMYSQVYFHHVRRAYDGHLIDFMKEAFGTYSLDLPKHLQMTDDRVMAALQEAANDSTKPGHVHAVRILQRGHFRRLYNRTPADVAVNLNAARLIFDAAVQKFGRDNVRFDEYGQKSAVIDFPVLMPDGEVASARSLSETLARVPVVRFQTVFILPHLEKEGRAWRDANKASIITPPVEE